MPTVLRNRHVAMIYMTALFLSDIDYRDCKAAPGDRNMRALSAVSHDVTCRQLDNIAKGEQC